MEKGRKAFAIVRFKDGSVSEVPSKWLISDDTKCWWPPSKNTSYYISKSKNPDKNNWDLSEVVRVEAFFETYEQAREQANHITYTTDEDIEDGTDDTSDVDETLRNVDNDGDFNFHDLASNSDCNDTANDALVVPPQLSNNLLKCVDSSRTSPNLVGRIVNLDQQNCLKCCREIEQFKTSLLIIQATLEELTMKINHLGVVSGEKEESESEISLKLLLPVCSKENFFELENFLDQAENKTVFWNFIQRIGGSGYKDNINRVLKKILTNEFAATCSWLGQRGNFRIAGTRSIETLKDVIQKSHLVQERIIEVCVSEWLRHSAQRLKRESGKTVGSNSDV